MNYSEIVKVDTANGPGCRVTLFCSGCRVHCKGCFSKQTWDFGFGKEFTISTENEILEAMSHDYIAGLTLCGGNPVEPENEAVLVPFVKRVKDYFPDKNIWCYSGYTFEQLLEMESQLLPLVDVIVDGPFVEEKKDLTLKFRGSSNQRLVDVKSSLTTGKVVELD